MKQNGLVCELGPVLLLFGFWFQILASGPKSSRYFRETGPWGPFLESPGSFTGPKPKFKIKTLRVVARVLAHKQAYFVSLTDSFTVLLSKPINRRSWMQTEQT